MKKVLFVALITGSMLTSCSKKSSDIPQLQTPLSTAIDSKFIHEGADETALVVEYSTYKSNADCDKAVYNAAVETVTQSGSINTVTVNGATLTIVFTRNALVQPAKTSLTYGTDLYKAVNKDWAWTGYLTIKKQNAFLTADQFDKAINAKVFAINTGDVAKITSKSIVADAMLIEYTLTSKMASAGMSYEMQASTPITLRSQFKVLCLIPGFFPAQTLVTLDLAKELSTPQQQELTGPKQKDLGGGVISYTQQVYPDFIKKSLSEYVAGRYFTEQVYPLIK